MMRVYLGLFFLSLVALTGCQKDNPTESGSAPTISGITPNAVARGEENVRGKIAGTNFTGIVVVDLGAGIQLTKTALNSSTEIAVRFNVSGSADPGARTIRVITSGGTATNSTVLSVQDNRPPVAAFSVSPDHGARNTVFTLDASASSDPDGTIVSYEWSFGDGTTASGKVIQHAYTSPGAFKVTLTVKDNSQGTNSASRDITVDNAVPPVAHFNFSPEEGTTATNYTFDGSPSTDTDGRITKYHWLFGDETADGKIVHHTFKRPDRFQVTLTVTDNNGLESSIEKEVRVRGIPPVATFSVSPSSGDTNTSFHFDATASHDPDGRIVRFQWNFADGTRETGPTADHKFTKEGEFNVVLVVIDNDDKSHSVDRALQVGEAGGGGGGDPEKCTTPSRKHEPFFFQVLSEDQATKTIVGKFYDNVSCSDVFYLCGDVRIGGIDPGSKEYWIGIICDMYDLGDNTFRIHLVQGKYWVQPGESETYVWPQNDCNPSVFCK